MAKDIRQDVYDRDAARKSDISGLETRIQQLELFLEAKNRSVVTVRESSADFTISHAERQSVYFLDGTSGTVTATLPTANRESFGQRITFKCKNSTNAVKVDGSGSETIETMSEVQLRTGDTLVLVNMDARTFTNLYTDATRAAATPIWRIESWHREPAVALSKAASYTILETDEERVFLDTHTSGNLLFTMPACDATTLGRRYVFKKTASGGNFSILRAGSDTIEGSASLALGTSQYAKAILYNPDGGGVWYLE